MEGPPSNEISPDNQHEQELSFDQQVELAKVLFNTVDERNVFTKRQGGFDTFAEVGQHVEGMRDEYDKLEAAVSSARKDFDEKISDKKEFVKKLRDAGEDDLADTIGRMFSIPKESIFSRFKK